MWECPDYFVLDDQRVLIVSPKGLETQYKGGFDTVYFTSDEIRLGSADFNQMQVLDEGTDFYAATTFFDPIKKRRLLWVGLAYQASRKKKSTTGGCLNFTRELRVKNEKLWMQPITELRELREQHQHLANNLVIEEAVEIVFYPQNQSAFSHDLSAEQASYKVTMFNNS